MQNYRSLGSTQKLIRLDRVLLFYNSNLKAITGQLTVTPVVPTSQIVPQSWQYTTNTPAVNWYASNFNASAWSTGIGGFGTLDPGVTPNTAWTTPGYIYLRRTFNPGALTEQEINNLSFTIYHDEDASLYINGGLAGSASGYSTAYINTPMTSQAKAAIAPNGTNVLAVSCNQTTGGQFIDVGISDQVLVANTFTVPTDATSSTSIGDGNWHMVAYTYTGIPGINNGLLYVDGVIVASDSVTTSPAGDNLDVWIGGSPDYGTARWVNAKIAHAAIESLKLEWLPCHSNPDLTAARFQIVSGWMMTNCTLRADWVG
jgi:hypothetical protein